MKFSSPRSARRNEQGYMLITLILFVALLAISLTAMAPELVQQMKRDREEELIHRGVQYSRAIQHFVKKFGRYPTTIEELQSTNDLHYLRKRYKDPITGKDFKILHMGDVQTTFGSGVQGGIPVANLAAGAAAAGNQGGGFGQSIFASSGFGNNSTPGGNSSGSTFGNSGSTFGNSGSTFGNSGSTFGNSGDIFGGGNTFGGNSSTFGSSGSNVGNNSFSFGNQGAQSTGANQAGSDNGGNQNQGNSGQRGQGQGSSSSDSSNKTFGGGPIVGVVSTSKEKTIRVFNRKDKYNEWQFIYDPSTDTGGLLNMPNVGQQAGGMGAAPNNNQSGQQSGFGFSGGTPFGSQGGQQQPVYTQQPSPYPPTPQQPQQPQFPPDQGPQ